MNITRTSRTIVAGLLLLTATLAGCGDGSDSPGNQAQEVTPLEMTATAPDQDASPTVSSASTDAGTQPIVATPWPDDACRYWTIEQAQQDLPFTIVYPEPIPDGFLLDGILADPWFETPADCRSAKSITMFYPLIDSAGAPGTNAVHISQNTFMHPTIDPAGPGTIELGGVYIEKSATKNLEGTAIQTYSWNTDEVGVSVYASLTKGISEADLMAFVTAMVE